MKKIISVLFVVVVFITSTSCSGEDHDSIVNNLNEINPNDSVIEENNNQSNTSTSTMKITIGDKVLTVSLADNSSAEALVVVLQEGPLSVDMSDYGNMEKVGSLGTYLPTNNEHITTEAGDVILYQGNALVIYYAPNTWNFTRLGKIKDVSAQELKTILGNGNVTVTLSLSGE